MSNVVSLKPRAGNRETRQTRLIAGLAETRHAVSDVFWLKENAELLGILAATGQSPEIAALDPWADFYDSIAERMRFFPQYYRFLLSICLDLEDIGMAGNKGDALCRWVAASRLPVAELSDLQRAEARRLLARRGAAKPVGKGTLGVRLHRFIARSETFAIPNKKAAYELTHIVFYLSDYGRSDPGLGAAAMRSLEFAGLLAFLDQNIDLLAEVCTALRFAGRQPSPIWDRAVAKGHWATQAVADGALGLTDACHEYLVTGWALDVAGQGGFAADVPAGPLRFRCRQRPAGVLRSMSECMFGLSDARRADWSRMRRYVMADLGQYGHALLAEAEQSTDQFDAFFEGFARAHAI